MFRSSLFFVIVIVNLRICYFLFLINAKLQLIFLQTHFKTAVNHSLQTHFKTAVNHSLTGLKSCNNKNIFHILSFIVNLSG